MDLIYRILYHKIYKELTMPYINEYKADITLREFSKLSIIFTNWGCEGVFTGLNKLVEQYRVACVHIYTINEVAVLNNLHILIFCLASIFIGNETSYVYLSVDIHRSCSIVIYCIVLSYILYNLYYKTKKYFKYSSFSSLWLECN